MSYQAMSYQADLMLRLVAGAMALPEHERARHAAFLAACQNADGGFSGRRGLSDLYYTSFALRGLAMLGQLNEDIARQSADFLSHRLAELPLAFGQNTGEQEQPVMPAADFFSLVTSAMLVELVTQRDLFAEAGRERQRTVADFFARFRRGDGGYAKTLRGVSSTYQTFLVVLGMQLVGAAVDDADRIVGLIRARQRDDGGFVEVDALHASGVNPTAAAVELLRQLGGLEPSIAAAAVRFLAGMQTAEGGLRANTRIPVADLLSTFTGLATLLALDAAAGVDTAAAAAFVRSLQQPGGGFRAGDWDEVADVEYTFYGLGALALTSQRASP
jgi:geranylgeranyl transferase type-2 subunit beta